MASADLNIKTKVQVESLAIVRPGDKLLVGLARDLPLSLAEEYRDQLAERLPGVDIIVINANQLVVYRPAEDAP